MILNAFLQNCIYRPIKASLTCSFFIRQGQAYRFQEEFLLRSIVWTSVVIANKMRGATLWHCSLQNLSKVSATALMKMRRDEAANSLSNIRRITHHRLHQGFTTFPLQCTPSAMQQMSMHPFSISTDEYVTPKFFVTKYFIMIIQKYI